MRMLEPQTSRRRYSGDELRASRFITDGRSQRAIRIASPAKNPPVLGSCTTYVVIDSDIGDIGQTLDFFRAFGISVRATELAVIVVSPAPYRARRCCRTSVFGTRGNRNGVRNALDRDTFIRFFFGVFVLSDIGAGTPAYDAAIFNCTTRGTIAGKSFERCEIRPWNKGRGLVETYKGLGFIHVAIRVGDEQSVPMEHHGRDLPLLYVHGDRRHRCP